LRKKIKKYIYKIFILTIVFSLITVINTNTRINEQNNPKIKDCGDASLIVKYYKDFLDSTDGKYLYFKDGSKMEFDNSFVKLTYEDTLNNASLKDQMTIKYITGKKYNIPILENFDPGRVRCESFFKKIYGQTKEGVRKNLVSVNWLPKKLGKKILFTKLNGAASALQNVSNELEKLPDSCMKYIESLGGTYYWRKIAGTERLSMHSFGISIDINTKYSHYWRNSKPDKNGLYKYKNSIPFEIVEIFEKYGFIWGGKWYHYDTMHFEYRPELIMNYEL
jgi:hypothetical protein